jgi:hypothetical protein
MFRPNGGILHYSPQLRAQAIDNAERLGVKDRHQAHPVEIERTTDPEEHFIPDCMLCVAFSAGY